MAFDAQGKSFCPLDERPGGEWGYRCSLIPQKNRPDVSDKSGVGDSFCKTDAVVASVRFPQCGEFSGFPVGFPRFDDDSSQSRAVPADKFGRRMDDDICAVFNRAEEIGCSECIVNDDGQSVFMRELYQSVDIGNVCVGVPEGFDIKNFGVRANGGFHFG